MLPPQSLIFAVGAQTKVSPCFHMKVIPLQLPFISGFNIRYSHITPLLYSPVSSLSSNIITQMARIQHFFHIRIIPGVSSIGIET